MRPELHAGPFRLEREIGSGGMGVVWRASHRDGTPVAIKLLTDDAWRSPRVASLVRDEVRVIAGLDHPAIVALYDTGIVDPALAEASGGAFPVGSPWLAMELAPAGDLRRAPTSWTEVRDVLLALLDALAHAHARGVLHRDLKPDNVLRWDRRGGAPPVKLADFGLAAVIGASSDVRAGTPAFMAPEQITGRTLGPWTDLYALGCVAWALIAGRPPFRGSSIDRVRAHLHQPLPALVARFPVPSELGEWLSWLLEKSVEDRCERAADAAHALAAMRDVEGDAPSPTTELGANPTWMSTVSDVLPDDPTAEEAPRRRSAAPPFPPFPTEPYRSNLHLSEAGRGLFALRVPRLVGREAPRRALWSALADVHTTGRLGMVLLRGNRGVGKKRLARWLCERAHELGQADVNPPELPAADGLRPAIVRLDDVQQDPSALTKAAARIGEAVPVLFVATADEVALAAEPLATPWKEAIGKGARELVVGPLDEGETRELVGELLGLAPASAGLVQEASAGNPGVAHAIVGGWVAEGALRPTPQGFEAEVAGPAVIPEGGTLADTLQPLLDAARQAFVLGDTARSWLRLAEWERAAAELGLAPDDPRRAGGLLRKGALLRSAGRTTESKVLAEAALAVPGISAFDRAKAWAELCGVAQAAGETPAATEPLMRNALAAYEEASRSEMAAGLLLGCAFHAIGFRDLDFAERYADEAELLVTPSTMARFLRVRSAIARERGDRATAYAVLKKAMDPPPERALDVANVSNELGNLAETVDPDAAEAHYRASMAAYESVGGWRRCLPRVNLARFLLRRGRHAEAAQVLGEALREARSVPGHPIGAVVAAVRLGVHAAERDAEAFDAALDEVEAFRPSSGFHAGDILTLMEPAGAAASEAGWTARSVRLAQVREGLARRGPA